MRKTLFAWFSAALLVFSTIAPAAADYPFVTAAGTLAAVGDTVQIANLTGQSSCAVEVAADSGVTLAFEGVVQATWSSVLGAPTTSPTTLVATAGSAGTWLVSCASLRAFRVRATTAGSATINLTASGGVISRGLTPPVGASAPLTATTQNGQTTIGLTTPLALAYGGTGASSLPAGCLQSTGSAVTSTACPTPAPTASPVSVVGTGGAVVTTPSPGVFSIFAPTPSPTSTPVAVTGTGIAAVTQPSGGVFNVFVPSPAPAATPVSVQGGSNVAVATPSPGVFVVSATTPAPPTITAATTNVTIGNPSLNSYTIAVASPTPAPVATPVSVQAGPNTTVATPSPGVFVVAAVTPTPAPTPNLVGGTGISTSQAGTQYTITNTGVSSVTGTAPIASSGGTAPAISCPTCVTSVTAGSNIVTSGTSTAPTVATTQSPTFTGTATAATLNETSLTASTCLQADASKNIVTLATPYSNRCMPQTYTNNSVVLPSQGSTFTLNPITNMSYLQYGEILRFVSPAGDVTFDATFVSPSGNQGVSTFVATRYFSGYGGAGSTLPANSLVYPEGIAYVAGTGLALTSSGNAGPTFSNTGVTSLAAGDSNAVIGGTAQAPTVTVTQAPTLAALTVSGLTAGRCVQTTTGGSLTVASAACGSGNGTVTAVTGSGNIASSGGTTPNVTITSAPTFSGPVTSSQLISTVPAGTASILVNNGDATSGATHRTQILAGGNGIVNSVTPACLSVANEGVGYLAAVDCGGNLGVAAGVMANNLLDSALAAGQCLTTAQNNTFASRIVISTGAACASKVAVDWPLGTFGSDATSGGQPTAPANAYPFLYIATLGAAINTFNVSCIGADNGNSVFGLYNANGTGLASISLANGAQSGSAAISPAGYTVTTAQTGALHANLITKGSATYCTFSVSGTRNLQ